MNSAVSTMLVVGFFAVELATHAALTRRLWHEAVRFLILLDLAAIWLVRKVYPPRFEIVGACQKRAVCCRQIVGNPPRFIKEHTPLLQLFAAYHQVFHNFRAVARGPEGEVIFSCGHVRSDGRCGIYRFRPLLCRNFPVLPWFEPPRLLPGCGFRVVPRVLKKAATRAQPRPGLPILNPQLTVHHPSPMRTEGVQTQPPQGRPLSALPANVFAPPEQPEHYESFDDSDPPSVPSTPS